MGVYTQIFEPLVTCPGSYFHGGVTITQTLDQLVVSSLLEAEHDL